MTFCEQLNTYIKQIGCSSKELVNASGLSTSVISRYRRGDRRPNIRGKQLVQLADGLYELSSSKKLNITRDEIYSNLSSSLNDVSIDFEQLSKNFMVNYDESGNIGKRYRRQDIMGTPFVLTVDDETLNNNTVTIRNRDTMEQIILPLDEVKDYIEEKIQF